jgi:hypothetical protein
MRFPPATTPERLIDAENARVKVTAFCQQEKISQAAFGKMINSPPSTFYKFMTSVSGMGSLAYPKIINFFDKAESEQNKSALLSGK